MRDKQLNILPEERKKAMRKKIIMGMILEQSSSLFLITLILVGVLASLNFILKIKLDMLEKVYALENSRKEFQEIKEYERVFQEIELKTKQASKFQKDHFYWSKLLVKLEEIIPNGVYLTEISNKGNAVFLVGWAENRENLIEFQKRVESEECFTEVEVPVSDLVQKEDLSFQMDLKFELKCLTLSQELE